MSLTRCEEERLIYFENELPSLGTLLTGVISKTFNKGGSRGNVMKKGCGFCDHAHIFIEFKYYNQCFSKLNHVKSNEKNLNKHQQLQNVIITKVENHT